MTSEELREIVARIEDAEAFLFGGDEKGAKDRAAKMIARFQNAGLAIVPVVPTAAMRQAGQEERDDNAIVEEIWYAMLKAAQEGSRDA
jgi:hypothetical protein